MAEDLLQAIRDSGASNLSARCGGVLYNAISTAEAILADADRAMYRAKTDGGSSVSIIETP